MYIVIKHSIYLRGLTSKGNIACTKRRPETLNRELRVDAKLQTNMGRFTNPNYNFLAGSEVPIYYSSVRNYVVFLSLGELNKLSTSSRHKEGSSKLVRRRKRMEFAMTRNPKGRGLRRVHSTSYSSSGKGPSFIRLEESLLSGKFESSQLSILKSNIVNGQKCNNLSVIMSDPKFLIAAWVRIRSKRGSLTPALTEETLDRIKLSWFVETANTMRNGKLKFSPSRRTYILKSNGKERPLTVPSLRDKIVQEAMRFLLQLIFETDFSKDSHGWVTGRGCHTALNQIKLQFNHDNWYIEGDIDQQFPTLDHYIIVELLKTKIDDQAFVDLIYKYLRVGYGETSNQVVPM